MDLVGAWLRQLLRAGTAAAIVPVVLLAGLLVVAFGSGGLGGLDSLGQLVAGPAPPDMDAAGSSATENLHADPIAPEAGDGAPAREAAAPAPRAAGRSTAPAPGSRSARLEASAARIVPREPRSPILTAPARPEKPPAPTAPPPPADPTSSQQPPRPTDVLSTTVNGVVVGVQTLIDQLAQLLAGNPPRAR